MKTFGEKLKTIRLEQKLKQKDIAKVLGISTTCYAGYEQDYREPDIKTLSKLCIIFEISADYLLNLEDESGRKIYINNSFNNNSGNIDFKN